MTYVVFDRLDRSFIVGDDRTGAFQYVKSHEMARHTLQAEGLSDSQITELLNTAVLTPGYRVPVEWIRRVASVSPSRMPTIFCQVPTDER